MAYKCDICGKRHQVGFNVSHAHNKTKRRWSPNLQVVRHEENGRIRRIKACTQCIKKGRVCKPSPRPKIQAGAES
ncbi:MAG: 50S ribosomal protein L28 [Proteobacteria bacterium]|nr:50S ribosomal protein L28 [Pseudomonadota bacterium]